MLTIFVHFACHAVLSRRNVMKAEWSKATEGGCLFVAIKSLRAFVSLCEYSFLPSQCIRVNS